MGLFVLELLIALVIGLLFGVIGLFVGHIILFDSIALGITAAALVHNLLSVHSLFSILIGIALAVVVFFILNTKVGFWIVATLLSLVWCVLPWAIALIVTDGDPIWGYGIMAVSFIIFMVLHYRSYQKTNP